MIHVSEILSDIALIKPNKMLNLSPLLLLYHSFPLFLPIGMTLYIIENQYSFNVPSVNDPLTVAVARKAALNFISQNQILIGSSLTQ